MAASCPHLLEFPVETLQHIIGYVGPEWLPVLRLTCTTLRIAVDDAFAFHYLQDLCCFVMQPSRTERLNQIMTTPHLLSRVQRLTLTLGPFERIQSNQDLPMALNRGMDQGSSQRLFCRSILSQTFRDWEVALGGDWIYPSLAEMDSQRCKVRLDLLARMPESSQRIQPGLVQLLRAARCQKFDIDDIIIDDVGLCYPLESALNHEDLVSTLARSLTGFHFTFTAAALPSAPVAVEVSQRTKTLQRLSIDASALAASHQARPNTCPEQMWARTNLSHITELRLTGIYSVTFSELLLLFTGCNSTLQSLDMSWIWACEPSETKGWSSIFSCLQSAPHLQNLALANLHEFVSRHPWNPYWLISATEDRPPGGSHSTIDDVAPPASEIEIDLRGRFEVQAYLAYLSNCKISADPFAKK